jgi:hypothetical protein
VERIVSLPTNKEKFKTCFLSWLSCKYYIVLSLINFMWLRGNIAEWVNKDFQTRLLFSCLFFFFLTVLGFKVRASYLLAC